MQTIKMTASKKRGEEVIERVQDVSFTKALLRLRAKRNNPRQTWAIHPDEKFEFVDGKILPKEVKKHVKREEKA